MALTESTLPENAILCNNVHLYASCSLTKYKRCDSGMACNILPSITSYHLASDSMSLVGTIDSVAVTHCFNKGWSYTCFQRPIASSTVRTWWLRVRSTLVETLFWCSKESDVLHLGDRLLFLISFCFSHFFMFGEYITHPRRNCKGVVNSFHFITKMRFLVYKWLPPLSLNTKWRVDSFWML